MSAPTTPDLVTLRLPRDVAREYLRVLESLISEADDAAAFLDATDHKDLIVDLNTAMRDSQPLRDAIHAALYCEVTT